MALLPKVREQITHLGLGASRLTMVLLPANKEAMPLALEANRHRHSHLRVATRDPPVVVLLSPAIGVDKLATSREGAETTRGRKTSSCLWGGPTYRSVITYLGGAAHYNKCEHRETNSTGLVGHWCHCVDYYTVRGEPVRPYYESNNGESEG